MKKVVVGVLLLLGIAGAAAPLVSGLAMERIVKQSFNNLNIMYSEIGSGVSIQIMHYDRHYRFTELEWKVRFGGLKALYGIDEITFVDRADHGLTGIVSHTSLDKNKWFTDFVNDKLGGKNPITIVTEYTLSGHINSIVAMDAFTLPMQGETVEVKPGKIVSEYDADLKNFSSELSWDGCLAADKLRLDSISLTASLEKVSTYLWDASFSLAADKARLQKKKKAIDLHKLKVDYSLDVDQDENQVSVVTELGLDHLAAGRDSIDNGFVRFGVVNIDMRGFEEFMRLYSRMTNTLLRDLNAAGDDPGQMQTIFQQQMGRIQFQMITAYEQLLKKGLEFQISDLHATLPTGEVKGDVVLSLVKDMSFAQFVPIVQQPNLLMEVFSLQSDITLPARLVGDNPRLLSPLFSGMQTGIFVRDGDDLVSKAETRDGKLYLNDREVGL